MQASWDWIPELGKLAYPVKESAGTVSPHGEQGFFFQVKRDDACKGIDLSLN